MTSKSTRDVPESVGIKRLGLQGVEELLAQMQQPAYRAKQIVRWLYQRGATSYDQMTDLPADLRAGLADRLPLPYPRIVSKQASADGTRKYLLELADGQTIETVGLPAGDRLTVCFSTQAGCAMGCSFCATGLSGLMRNLGPGEMVDQIAVVASDFGRRVSNAVAMGQGEPFANYDNVIEALRLMNSELGLGIGARHLTVSTCGLVAGIARFAQEPEQFTLAVSLHSAVQSTRNELMPGVAGTSLASLRQAIDGYTKVDNRRVSLEYALIGQVNDTDEQLQALKDFCRGLLVHVNLIPANPVAESGYPRSSEARVRAFETGLQRAGIETSVRVERGVDIDAACGQLRQRAERESPSAQD